ncbi:MAG: tetraacyldisaccharide 4'-kinase, partial [Longimicrobiales bacterium]
VASSVRTSGVRACILVGAEGEDEALLHRTWNPGIPVSSGRDRVATAARARAEGAEVAVLDDGFQHHALARDLDIVLLSADDPPPGQVLPRGPYREPMEALGRADLVVVTRRNADVSRSRALEEGGRPPLSRARGWRGPSRTRGVAPLGWGPRSSGGW